MSIDHNVADEDMSQIILGAYSQAICAAKLVKKLHGAPAQRAACKAVAAVVSKHTGTIITDSIVYEIVRQAPGRAVYRPHRAATTATTAPAPTAPTPTPRKTRWWAL